MQLLHGDCLELMKNISDGSVDLVLTDPPYGTMRRKNSRPEVRLDDITWDYEIDPKTLLVEVKRILRPNGKCLIFCQEPYTSKLVLCDIPELIFCQRLHWLKNTAGNFLCATQNCMQYIEDIVLYRKNYRVWDEKKEDPTRQYMIDELGKSGLTKNQINQLIGCKSQASHYFASGMQFEIPTAEKYKILQKTGYFQKPYSELQKQHEEFQTGLLKRASEKYPSVFNLCGGNSKSNVFEYPKDNDGYHPTQKPVALLEDLILTYSNEGETVLDSCMGSGSTGVACVNTNRDFIGIELDENYFRIAEKRIDEAIKNADMVERQCNGL